MAKTYQMNRSSTNRESIAEDRTVWIGIDDHKRKFSAVVLGEDDEVLAQETHAKEKRHIEGIVERLPGCQIHAVYEAGSTGYKMLRWLEEAGVEEARMTPPALVPTRHGDQVKTDRRDATKLAKCLKAGMLERVYDHGDQGYADRELVRSRKQLVQHRADLCRQIRSKLQFHGIEVPDQLTPSNWSNTFLEWLEEGPSQRPTLNTIFETFVDQYRSLTERIRQLEGEIRQMARQPRYAERVELLTTAPGVGLLTAMVLLVEVGRLDRFDNCEQLAAYLGLIPSEHSSGERESKGSLVRTGNKRVQTALIEASWQAIGKDGRLREVYDRIKRRRGDNGSKIAIVAVARRLALALRAMIRDGKAYRLDPPSQTGDRV